MTDEEVPSRPKRPRNPAEDFLRVDTIKGILGKEALDKAASLITRNTVIFTTYFILCSAILLGTYYEQFGIPIFDYLSFGELLIRFIKDIIGYFLFIVFVWVAVIVFANMDRFSDKMILGLLIQLLIFGVVLSAMSAFPFVLGIMSIFVITGGIIFSSVVGFTFTTRTSMILCLTLPLLLNSIYQGSKLPKEFKANPQLHSTSIEFSDNTKTPAFSQPYLVGMTDEFLFFYYDQTGQSEVKSRSDVKKISIGQLPLSGNFSPPSKFMEAVRTFWNLDWKKKLLYSSLGIGGWFVVFYLTCILPHQIEKRKKRKAMDYSQN